MTGASSVGDASHKPADEVFWTTRTTTDPVCTAELDNHQLSIECVSPVLTCGGEAGEDERDREQTLQRPWVSVYADAWPRPTLAPLA